VDILFVATSTYNDPCAEEWNPDLRHTVSFLRRHGVDAAFVYVPLLDDIDAVLDRATVPPAVFIDLTEENLPQLQHFIAALYTATPRTTIIAGGIPATLSPDTFFKEHPHLDLIVAGEREQTLLEIVQRQRAGADVRDVTGLYVRGTRNAPRPLLKDLDVLGSMIHDGLAEMLGHTEPEERTGFLISSRGCYAYCTFCGVPDFYRRSRGRPWRGRTAKTVVDEIQQLHETFGIRRFVFQDDNFIGPAREGQERARAMAREIMQRGLKIRYFFCCRINDGRAETITLLKESGLAGIGVSVESMNDESLHLLGKGIRPAAIESTLDLLVDLRIACEVNMIFFDPTLTLAGVRRNLALIERLRASEYLSYSDAFPFRELSPFCWSRVARTLRAEGLLNEEIARYRYRDPAVAQLAVFVRRLEMHLPMTFKKRLVLDDNDAVPTGAGKPYRDALLRLAPALRHWIGLTVVPGYIAAACGILERSGGNADAELDALEQRFIGEIEPLQLFRARTA
jgi:radical SAM superfamily enzyme YgiQ (UPF0313 family)